MGAAEDAESLRRRLYGPAATAADHEAYRRLARPPAGAVAVGAPELEADDAPDALQDASPEAPRRRRRRPVLLVGAAVLVAAIGVAVVPVTGRPVTATSTPTATSSPATGLTGDRAVFVDRLVAGRSAGILRWLAAHPAERPVALVGAHDAASVEHRGTGTAVVDLAVPGAVTYDAGGRLTVVVVVDRTTTGSWTALRFLTRDSPIPALEPVATVSGTAVAGVPVGQTVRFAKGLRPLRLRVDVPPGTAWGVAAVFTDRGEGGSADTRSALS